MEEEREQEERKLRETLEKYKEVLEDIGLVIKSLPKKYEYNPETLESLLNQYENKQRILIESLKKPYFARIDFKDDSEEKEDICYIGKVGISDFDNNIITIDWRSPIASLYYDSDIGPSSYQAPAGIITGFLSLKRQYEIEEGTLLSFHDVDIVANDEILNPYLSVNIDHRLKNIVSTIQKEQNEIIRENCHKNIIIQGVAGSGKTTVALHRIAYLAYNYKDRIKSNQYLIIGPNKFFMNYISSVLPDLDVTDVPQLTYEEFTKSYLKEDFIVKDSLVTNEAISDEKVCMPYQQKIDNYIKKLEMEEVLPDKDLIIKGFHLLPKEVIKNIYNSIDDTYFKNIEAKIERCILMSSTYLKEQSEKIIGMLNREYTTLVKEKETEKEKDKLLKNYQEIKKEVTTTGCSASLRNYFAFKKKKTTLIYNKMLKEIGLPYEKNTYTQEDLPGLIYLHYKLHGSKGYDQYKQTVIDEAQDYGTFHFYVLNQVLSNSSFSIFGDLAQSIYEKRSIENWDLVVKESFENDCDIKYLLKSYRTTIEIMNTANQVLNYIGLQEATPVIRHGEEVKIIKIPQKDYQILLERIHNLEKKYRSIALISRTQEQAKNIANHLLEGGIKIKEITQEDTEYTGGICSLSSELSKGLEFDAVIITNASEHQYSSKNSTDMKNLYVGMTRPLHKLEILYEEELTKPLQKCLTKKTT